MALSRIRANNTEFRNASLVGAQIRVRGGAESPFVSGPLGMRAGGPSLRD